MSETSKTTPEIAKVMDAIRTLDDIGRFSENLDYVVLAGEARDAFQKIIKRASQKEDAERRLRHERAQAAYAKTRRRWTAWEA